MPESSSDSLASALTAHGLQLPPEQVDLLERYCRLLWDWNAKLNLTRHTDYTKFVARDLVDTFAFARFLAPGERVLDVGTGGGVPGVVLRIVRPDVPVELCESVGKRARVVTEIVQALGLGCPLHLARVEDLLPRSRYNTLIARAVARLGKLLEWFRPHWGRFDRALVLKGPAWVDERAEARHQGLLGDLALRKLVAYPLSGTESESVLLQICPKDRLVDDKICPLTDLSQPTPDPPPPPKDHPKGHRQDRRGLRSRPGGRRPSH